MSFISTRCFVWRWSVTAHARKQKEDHGNQPVGGMMSRASLILEKIKESPKTANRKLRYLRLDYGKTKSAHSAPDQLSVKDSGRRDNEFNDSHSDISGERLKKPPSEMMENQVPSAEEKTYKDAESYHSSYAQQLKTRKTFPLHYENDYTIAYSTMPIYQHIPQFRKSNFNRRQPKLK